MKQGSGKLRRRRIRLVLLGLLLALVLAAAIYVADYYRADETARAVLADPAPGVQVQTGDGCIVFSPDEAKAGLIFYPGGKVEYTAYAPLMEDLAEEGVLCVLLKMPLNLAVLTPNAAEGVRDGYPDVPVWAVGGHSLGGVMAARYAANHPEDVDAVVLLASYSTSDLTQSGVKVLSLYGTEDGVLQWDKCRAGTAVRVLRVGRLQAVRSRIGHVPENQNHSRAGGRDSQKGDRSTAHYPRGSRRVRPAGFD